MKISKACLKRTLRTFIQAFLGYVVVNVAMIDFSDSKQAIKTAFTGLGVSAVAAGLAAVMNLKGDSNENGSMGEKEPRQED